MIFHVFRVSRRFGPFSHVFHEFFVPADGEKREISGRILLILDSWAMARWKPKTPACWGTGRGRSNRVTGLLGRHFVFDFIRVFGVVFDFFLVGIDIVVIHNGRNNGRRS